MRILLIWTAKLDSLLVFGNRLISGIIRGKSLYTAYLEHSLRRISANRNVCELLRHRYSAVDNDINLARKTA